MSLEMSLELSLEEQETLYPNPRLSILSFIHEFPLPVVTTVNVLSPIENFFKEQLPGPFGLDILKKFPLPPKSIVEKLVLEAPRQWEAGKRSLVYAHLAMLEPQHLPFGVLHYWEKMTALRGMQLLWLKAEQWVRESQRKLKLEEDHQLACAVLCNFEVLSWSDSLNGFTWSAPIKSLVTYLGTNWLTNDEMDQMIQLLIYRLSAESIERYQLQELSFINSLLPAHRTVQVKNEELSELTKAIFDRLGNALASGKCLVIGGFAHVRSNHWIGWIFDSQTWTMHYADSKRHDIDPLFYSAMAWWLGFYSDQPLQIKDMPISIQLDSDSCGPFSFNALEHFLFPGTPLIPQSRVQVLWYQIFLRVSHRHLEMTPDTSRIVEESQKDNNVICSLTFESPGLYTREALIEQNRYLINLNSEFSKNLKEMKEEEATAKNLIKETHTRELATLRQRKKRMREQSEKDDKKRYIPLKSNTDSVLPDLIAENSRPFREFKEHSRKDKKRTGRIQKNKPTQAVYVNWFTPLLWIQIQEAGKRWELLMRPTEIVHDLKKRNPKLFGKLTPQVLGWWIDRTGEKPCWSENTLNRVQTTGNLPQSHAKCPGILKNYPDTVDKIKQSLSYLREAGTPLTLIMVRAIIIAHLEHYSPEIFKYTYKNGHEFNFHCTDSFVKKFLHKELQWSWRRATQAAQKLPPDYKQCEEAVLRIAWVLKDQDIPSALFVNTDQTGIVYAQGADITWGQTGLKQISVVGGDEKRAFTLVPSIAADGTLLPFQAVYKGKSTASLPSTDSPKMKESLMAGFVYSFSGTDNHWSTHNTMHELVDKIIAPYFENKKKALGLPPEQKSLWYIDCWSLHRSEEFRTWMAINHANIIILYIPANCTAILQPCDGGIQRPLKLCIKRASHEDLVYEIMAGFEEMEIPAHQI